MKLETSPEVGLDKVLQQKQSQYSDLFEKLNTLTSPVLNVSVSYSLGLDYNEQIKYAKIGIFHYYTDLNNLSTIYKQDNTQ